MSIPDLKEKENHIVTMGCRLNLYESDIMQAHLKENKVTDTIIINSCAVTSEAVRQAKQKIRQLKRQYPEKKIIVTGCAAQTEPETFADMQEVNKIVGNHEKLQQETFQPFALDQDEKILVNDIMSVKETAGHLIEGLDKRARAYLQIQNGCNHRCTFCIIPFGRGNARSVPAGVVIDNIKKIVDHGTNEVVLTGVDITSWGEDLPGKPPLGYLIDLILKQCPDLPRLRLSSVDSIEIDPLLQEIITSEKRFMPHLHLSLQSGDNMILKRMKRRHSRDQAMQMIQDLRSKRPDIIFGADIIAGFPTETEEMFQNSADFLRDAPITYGHIFPFSPRQGTPAAKMPQVEKSIIKQRSKILRNICQENNKIFMDSLIGSTQYVIIEEGHKGRCENFALIPLENQGHLVGSLHEIQLVEADDGSLMGV